MEGQRKRTKYPSDEELTQLIMDGEMTQFQERLKDRTEENRFYDLVFSPEGGKNRREKELMNLDVLMLICVHLPFHLLMECANRYVLFAKVILRDEFWRRYIVRKFGAHFTRVYTPEMEAVEMERFPKNWKGYSRFYPHQFWRRYFNVLYYIFRGYFHAPVLCIKSSIIENPLLGVSGVSTELSTRYRTVTLGLNFAAGEYRFEVAVPTNELAEFCHQRKFFTKESFVEILNDSRKKWWQLVSSRKACLNNASICHVVWGNVLCRRFALTTSEFTKTCFMDPWARKCSIAMFIYRGAINMQFANEPLYLGVVLE